MGSVCSHCTGEGWEDASLVLSLNIPKKLPQAQACRNLLGALILRAVKPQRPLRSHCHPDTVFSWGWKLEVIILSPWPHSLHL